MGLFDLPGLAERRTSGCRCHLEHLRRCLLILCTPKHNFVHSSTLLWVSSTTPHNFISNSRLKHASISSTSKSSCLLLALCYCCYLRLISQVNFDFCTSFFKYYNGTQFLQLETSAPREKERQPAPWRKNYAENVSPVRKLSTSPPSSHVPMKDGISTAPV